MNELLHLSPGALQQRMDRGHPLDPRMLDDSWYRGTSLGLWGWVERLSWKTFAKTFHRDPITGRLRGWNIRLAQDGLGAEPRPLVRGGAPLCFGRYEVVEEPNGLLIHYGRWANPWWDLAGLVRDPIVALSPDDPTRLLGRSLVQVGPVRVKTPSFFLLERVGPLPFVW